MKITTITTLFVLGLLPAWTAFGQKASYPFDGNANDSVAVHHGTVSTSDFSWNTEGARSFASIGDDGLITLPGSLSTGLMSAGSMEFNFEFRLTDTTDSGAPEIPFCILKNGGSAPWQNAGFMFFLTVPPDPSTPYNLIFAFNDGVVPAGHLWKTVGQNLITGQWVRVRMVIDTARGHWLTEVNGIVSSGAVRPNFDAAAFRSAIESSVPTIGGHYGSPANNWTADFDFDNLTVHSPAQADPATVNAVYEALTNDLLGQVTLTEAQKQQRLDTLKTELLFAELSQISEQLFAYTAAYEAANPPLYQDGVARFDHELPIHGQALLFSQEHLIATQYSPANVENMAGVVFEHSKVMPGAVAAGAARLTGATVAVNGTYQTDPAITIGDQHFVLRPTGYYAAPGEIVTVSAPAGVTNSGFSVVVGAHVRDMDPVSIGKINRFKDISLAFPLDSAQIKVVNPLGGGIYLRVPDDSTAGWIDLTIDAAIKSPYFSGRAGRQTDVSAWLAEVAASGAPWADFESDKYMFTVPASSLAGVMNPGAIMHRWDQNLDSFRIVSGRPLERRRAEYYILDTRLVTRAYGSGYPMVISLVEFNQPHGEWNPLTAIGAPPHKILFHEMGHNAVHPTLLFDDSEGCSSKIEAESVVHINATHIYNTQYGMSLEQAFAESGAQGLTFDEAAFDWIITTNFRTNSPMGFDASVPMPDKDMMKYQHRSWAKYIDITKLFGWSGLGAVNGKFYKAGVPQTGTACPSKPFVVGRDEYIRAASDVLGVNMAPLFHFWGIHPSQALATELSSRPKSQKIKALIETYKHQVAPQDLAAYTIYHNSIYNKVGYQRPRYEDYITQFDSAFATAITAQFDLVLQSYGLVGPAAPTGLQGAASGSSVTLNWQDNSNDETGFVISARRATGAEFEIVAAVGSNVTSYSVAGLPEGSYDFRVTSKNSEQLESDMHAENPVTIVITTADPYQQWVATSFPSTIDQSRIGHIADPNGDGISNIFAFLHGGSPLAYDAGILAKITRDATHFTVEFAHADQATFLAPIVEFSTNMTNWTRAIDGQGGVTVTVEDDGIENGIDKVTVLVPHGGVRVFTRLSVDLQ